MPDQLTSAGLEVKTVSEILSNLIQGFQAIYGTDINISQNTPDGQMLNVFSQASADLRELLVLVYNSFAVDQAFGTLLDQRVALNGLSRKAGTYTFTNIDVTVDRAVTLPGLDAAIGDADGSGFTVSDDSGNQFILAATQALAGAGTYTVSFRAKNIGAVETLPNTIVDVVTVTLGVSGVNNPSAATSVGTDEESDLSLKLRHVKSFLLAAIGPVDSIEAALESTTGVTDALVAENTTGGTVSTIPAHTMWAIVEGGTNAEVAQAIYAKKAPGCGMKGSVTYDVPRPNGMTFTAKFDRPTYEDLYVKFTLVPKRAGIVFDTSLIAADLVSALVYKLGQSANIGDVVVAMLSIAPDGILTTIGVSSDGVTYVDILAPLSYQHKFALSTSRIAITV